MTCYLNEKSQPCRINITVFAANPEHASAPESSPTTQPEAQSAPSRTDGDDAREVGSIPEVPPASSTEEKTTLVPERPLQDEKEKACGGQTPILKELPEPTTHGPRFLALPKEEQAMLLRAHKNLCHPSPAQFNAVLKQQGARPELQQAVWDMTCNACAANQKPKIARPSTVKHELDFNDKIFVDGITWNSKNNKTFHFYHIIDQATNYHVAIPAPSRTAENAVRCVSEAWLLWAGAPNMIVTDSATEFLSETFGEFLQRHDIKPVTTAPYAHWQNGRCERHGDILQSMLTKVDLEHPIETYDELQQALLQCTGAKNKLSIRRGYSPEVLVFGKCAKLPGSLSSSEGESSLASADREDALGIAFRKSLALRERARIAFHQADNDMALRRACLRRSRPLRDAYEPGEWVMMWQPTATGGHWFGPLKVVTQENQYSVWATQGGKIHRRAPEHIRPVCSSEARSIPTNTEPHDDKFKINSEGTISQNNQVNPDDDNLITNNPHNPPNINDSSQSENQSLSQEQPDDEPEAMTPQDSQNPSETHDPAVETPVPELGEDSDEFITTHLLCCEDEVLAVDTAETPCAWRCELDAPSHLCHETFLTQNADEILLATTEKKQRTEVKLSMLSEQEKVAFQKAKETEVNNWLKTGTVSKILRDKLAPEQILRCRWILVWKPLEGGEHQDTKASKLLTHKPKARLVVLGYMDPKLTEVPRDSPTLGRQSKMLILQLIASMGWSLGSFDIKAAFLQGRPQRDRIIGLEPVVELAKAMNLSSNEICRLDKSAYGLIDAPYLWFKTLHDELTSLGFFSSPFDPCVYLLKNPKTKELSGVLGIHVDDGIHGGDSYFHQQISKLEQKYPFGSKKSRTFTFTGIDLQQNPDNSIELSQSKYVKNINPITMTAERRADENAPVTEKERHLLRGLIGSLQYAAVHTRPDLASSLSFLQSDINKATVSTLTAANKALHIAKKHHDVTIKIKPIRPEDLRFLAFSDASFASKAKPESHAGMIILATHKDISQNKACPISPISWGTKKIQRVVTSTLSAETSALSTTLDQLTWLRLYWAWIFDQTIRWQNPSEVFNLPKAITVPTMKIEEKDLAITDCKSLFDLTTRTAVPNCQEYRTQLQARAIKDTLAEGIQLHWVHSGAQLADALTKVMESTFLRMTLRQGTYCLHDIHEVLKERACTRNRLRWLKSTTNEMSYSQLFIDFLGV